jgi:uncharacterized protein YjgD (DUF1641 family)
MKLVKGVIDNMVISSSEIGMALIKMNLDQLMNFVKTLITNLPEIAKAALIDAGQSLKQLLALDTYKA